MILPELIPESEVQGLSRPCVVEEGLISLEQQPDLEKWARARP